MRKLRDFVSLNTMTLNQSNASKVYDMNKISAN